MMSSYLFDIMMQLVGHLDCSTDPTAGLYLDVPATQVGVDRNRRGKDAASPPPAGSSADQPWRAAVIGVQPISCSSCP